MADRARFFDGKKYMWDGREYEDKKQADEALKEYRDKGFDVQTCSDDGQILIYTRRIVTEIEVT